MPRSSRKWCLPLLFIGSVVGAQAAVVDPAPPAAAESAEPSTDSKLTLSSNSTIGELLGDPAAVAVLEKYLPGITTNLDMRTEQAAGFRFSDLKAMAPEYLTDAVLAAIDADLAALKRD